MIGQPYPPQTARKEIVFVRHAESQANVDRVWNGQSDGPLSDYGTETLTPLGERLSRWDFDVVISSPLERTRLTAASFSDEVVIDESFKEMNLGRWEGKHFADIQEHHGDQLRAAFDDHSRPMGETGESLQQVSQRALAAVDRVFEQMSDGQRVAVVTHGGFMQSVLRRHLAGPDGRVHAFTSNTAITRVTHQFGRPRLMTFNDTGHLGPRSKAVNDHLEDGNRVVALIRHGRTQANVDGLWQGQGDWDLDDLGHRQASALADFYGVFPTVYTSPLKRARSTAAQVSKNGAVSVDGLMELNMGNWEGLTTAEIAEQYPGQMETIFRDGNDLPRGGTGETWSQLANRVGSAVDNLKSESDQPTVVVSHGGAIRAYLSSLTKSEDTHGESLFTPANTSVTHLAFTSDGPEIVDYSVAAHLEGLT